MNKIRIHTENGRARKTLYVKISSAIEVDPWLLLEHNLHSEMRAGRALDGTYFLSIDFLTESGNGMVEKKETLLKKFATKIEKGKLSKIKTKLQLVENPAEIMKSFLASFQINNDEINEVGLVPINGQKFEIYSTCKNIYALVHRLPLFRFYENLNSEENLSEQLEKAPAYFACYANTRIHFGNLFYAPNLGWGIGLCMDSAFVFKNQEYILRFSKLCMKIMETVWPNLITLYNEPKIAREFLIRNGLTSNSKRRR